MHTYSPPGDRYKVTACRKSVHCSTLQNCRIAQLHALSDYMLCAAESAQDGGLTALGDIWQAGMRPKGVTKKLLRPLTGVSKEYTHWSL